MWDDYILHKVEVRRGRAARGNAVKKPQHLRGKWIVARQLSEIRDEQNYAEIDAENDEQRPRNGSRQRDVASIFFSRCERCSRFKRAHRYCVGGLGFNSQSTLMIFQSPLNF